MAEAQRRVERGRTDHRFVAEAVTVRSPRLGRVVGNANFSWPSSTRSTRLDAIAYSEEFVRRHGVLDARADRDMLSGNQSAGVQMLEKIRTRRGAFASVSAMLLALAMTVGVVTPAAATITTSMCEFAIFVGVRGTNAPEGTGLKHGDRAWSYGGFGETQLIRNKLASSDIPYYAESLAFNATNQAPYPTIVNFGRTMLVAELNYLNSQCPWSPIVLAGHSMGADVVLSALEQRGAGAPNLTSSARGQIYAAAVFGDPTYVAGKPYNAPGNGTNNGVFARGNTASIEAMRTWGWPWGATDTQGWVYKVRSYCRPGDFWCQGNLSDSSFTIHNNYSTQMVNAYKWIEFMLTSTD